MDLRKLDALIHETVFKKCPHPEDEQKYYCIEDGNSVDSGYTCGRCGVDVYGKQCPEYHKDIAAAFRVEREVKLFLRHKHPSTTTDSYVRFALHETQGGGIKCIFERDGHSYIAELAEGEVAFVICLAALKAHGVDVSEFEKEAAQ